MNTSSNESLDALNILFKRLIYDASEKLYHYTIVNSEYVRISAPDIIISYYKNFLRSQFLDNSGRDDTKFMGISIIPSSDWALTLFHKDYPQYQLDWMIHKIVLTVPQKTIHNRGHANEYEKLIVQVTDMFSFLPKENPELN